MAHQAYGAFNFPAQLKALPSRLQIAPSPFSRQIKIENDSWMNELIKPKAAAPTDVHESDSCFPESTLPYTSSSLSLCESIFDSDSLFDNRAARTSVHSSSLSSPLLTENQLKETLSSVESLPDLFYYESNWNMVAPKPESVSTRVKQEPIQNAETEIVASPAYTPAELETPPSVYSETSASAEQTASPSTAKSKPKRKRNPRKRLTDDQKQAHNKIEKKYRININTKIAGLQSIIPWLSKEKMAFNTGRMQGENGDEIADSQRLNKSMILEKATDYILHIQKELERVSRENEELRGQISS